MLTLISLFPLLVVCWLLWRIVAAGIFPPSHLKQSSRLWVCVRTYLSSLLLVALVTFVSVMLIAGPHSGFLTPGPITQYVFITGLVLVIVAPLLATYIAWHRAIPNALPNKANQHGVK